MSHFHVLPLLLVSVCLLGISSERHQPTFHRTGRWVDLVRLTGWLGISAAYLLAISSWSFAIGTIFFTGHASLCCGITYLLLISHSQIRAWILARR